MVLHKWRARAARPATFLASRNGADKLVLGVMEDNPAGCRAYQRLGFAFTGQRDHIRDGRSELWMDKDL